MLQRSSYYQDEFQDTANNNNDAVLKRNRVLSSTAAALDVLRDENLISISPFLPIVGLLSVILMFGFCVGLVVYPLANSDKYTGSLTYISQGMDLYCGWSEAVLGSCGMFIALCELIAALHTSSWTLQIAIGLQTVTWFIIIGVSGTGWGLHYISLVIFLSCCLYYHWTLASYHPLAGPFYQKTNMVTAFNILVFFISFIVANSFSAQDDRTRIALDITVSLELTLMSCISVQNVCVLWVLLRYKNIHIIFENANSEDDLL